MTNYQLRMINIDVILSGVEVCFRKPITSYELRIWDLRIIGQGHSERNELKLSLREGTN